MAWLATLLSLLATSSAALQCTTRLDCQLNGACEAGRCRCEASWAGRSCGRLVERESWQVAGGRDTTSWGATLLSTNQTSHTVLVSVLTHSCPLADWQTNSRLELLQAERLAGPWRRAGLAVSTWSHNPAAIALADGSYGLFHVGRGVGPPDGGKHCSNALPAPEPGAWGGPGSIIHTARSPTGPWRPLQTSLSNCNNPAPWQHGNGTLFCVCGRDGGHTLLRAARLAGPWRAVAALPRPDSPTTHYEDPFLWQDGSQGWHVLLHAYNTAEDRRQCANSTVSAHLYSEDGLVWRAGAGPAYTTQLLLRDRRVTVSTRERPSLVMDSAGRPSHLLTAVCTRPACPAGPPTGCVDCKLQAPDITIITRLGP